jgi:hypothetical protein
MLMQAFNKNDIRLADEYQDVQFVNPLATQEKTSGDNGSQQEQPSGKKPERAGSSYGNNGPPGEADISGEAAEESGPTGR